MGVEEQGDHDMNEKDEAHIALQKVKNPFRQLIHHRYIKQQSPILNSVQIQLSNHSAPNTKQKQSMTDISAKDIEDKTYETYMTLSINHPQRPSCVHVIRR